MKTPKLTSLFSLTRIVLTVAGTITAMQLSVTPAKGAAALWVSAWNWSYSAALAQSPQGTAYYWGLSVGAGSFSWAYAFSNDGLGDAGYAFAEAATRQGGMGAVQVAGFADPWAGESIDIGLDNPANPSDFQTTDPSSDPFSSSYTVSDTGITFSGTGEELSGDDEIEAFVYDGSTSESGLDSELGGSGLGGNLGSGDVSGLSALESDFGLIALDAPVDDPSSLSSLNFTENTGDIDGGMDNVVLVGVSDAPEPGALSLLAVGMAASGLVFKKRNRA